MSRVLCFGELLLRLSPELNGAWIREAKMPVFIGGAELNAATALAKWKVPVAYCTALPPHYLSSEIVAHIASMGIGTNSMQLLGERIGTYYLPQGADMKNAGVIYDRAHSSFWNLQPGQLNWDELLDDVSWFHFSAISPALNASVASVCEEALIACAKKGITVSVDLNYRSKLWQYGKLPSDIMPALVAQCDVVMGNLWAAEKMLGITVPADLADDKSAYVAQSEHSAAAIMEAFPRCRQVANTFRFDRGAGILYYATLFSDDLLYTSREHRSETIVDKVGSGDTFMAGLIYGNFNRHAPQQVIDFAAAAAYDKLFIKGDATTSSIEDISKRI